MIKFGPSGNSEAFTLAGLVHTEDSAKWVADLGLNAFEYSFGRGVRITTEKANKIGEKMREYGIEISGHAPYYINFANPDDEMAEKSYGYVLDSARAVRDFGGKRVIIHPATQGKMERSEAVALTIERLKKLRDYIYLNGYQDMLFCLETMGKHAQIGTTEEIVEFCKVDKIYLPCIDFGHVNAREGGSLKRVEDFDKILDLMINELGYERVKHFHVHFSKIMYSSKGEIKHLTFEDDTYGPNFEPLALSLKKRGLEPVIICESAGTQDRDAKICKEIYNKN